MKILIITSASPYKAAGIVALDLFQELKSLDNDVKMLVKECKSDHEEIISFSDSLSFKIQNLINRIYNLYNKIINKKSRLKINSEYHIQDYNQTITYYNTSSLLKSVKFKPEAIIILFMQGFISYKNIYELNKQTQATVYLYPMDMAPFTGGCHYAWNCIGYMNKCGYCPAINSNNEKDITRTNLEYKQSYIQRADVKLFACNEQIYSQIKSSSIFKNKEVFNGIYPVPDESVFKLKNKSNIRERLQIGKNEIVFLFGAVSLSDKRKGMSVLIEALSKFSLKLKELGYDEDLLRFLVVGSNINEIRNKVPFKLMDLGYIKDYSILADVYNAADYFICPSIEETGPTMVLQSVLCETIVISFNIGYSMELFKGKLKNLIAEETSSTSLSECLLRAIMLNNEEVESYKEELKQIKNSLNIKSVVNRINKLISCK